ncbi:MAG: DUF4212 domain-containing protein [Guyparkeria sp.]
MDYSKSQEEYWKANLGLLRILLIIWALVSFGGGILFRPLLQSFEIGGAGLHFWFAQQGSIVTFIVLIFFYSWRMNVLDRKFGVEEE